MTVLQTYYNPTMLEAGHALSPSGVYQSLDLPNHKAFLDYIASLPIIASPDVFGLHDNADISKDLKETNLLLDSLLLTQSRDAAGGSGHPHLHTIQTGSSDGSASPCKYAANDVAYRAYCCTASRHCLCGAGHAHIAVL